MIKNSPHNFWLSYRYVANRHIFALFTGRPIYSFCRPTKILIKHPIKGFFPKSFWIFFTPKKFYAILYKTNGELLLNIRCFSFLIEALLLLLLLLLYLLWEAVIRRCLEELIFWKIPRKYKFSATYFDINSNNAILAGYCRYL